MKYPDSIKIIKDVASSSAVQEAAQKMQDSGVLQETIESKEAKQNLDEAKKELAKEFEEVKWEDRKELQVANAIANGISKGLDNLVKGYETKSPYYIFSGSFRFIYSPN